MKPAASDINLQVTLASANGNSGDTSLPRHHPINCSSEVLWLEEDGRMGCDHGPVAADDPRTQACIDQSVAILLIEILRQKEDGDAR